MLHTWVPIRGQFIHGTNKIDELLAAMYLDIVLIIELIGAIVVIYCVTKSSTIAEIWQLLVVLTN